MSESAHHELIMPVSDDHALQQFQIEALRQITDNLKRLNDKSDKQADVLETINIRLIRIESNKLDRAVETLKAKVDALEADRDRRDGATGIVHAITKSPVLAWLAAAALAVWTVLSGRIQP